MVATLALGAPAFAGGVTTHVVAGQMVINQVDGELKQFLQDARGPFLHGTYYPDAVLNLLQSDPKTKDDAENASHGRKQNWCEAPKGWMHHFMTKYRADCLADPKTENCRRRFAFFLGAVTHLVTDGPWHSQYIFGTAKKLCDPCLSDMQEFSYKKDGKTKIHYWCHPGGKDTWRNKETGAIDDDIHNVADLDFDLCLANALRGEAKNVISVRNPLIYAQATRAGKAGCPGGSFFDPRNGGECWQCPDGLKRTLYPVDDDKACTSNFGGIETRTADYQRKRNFIKGCPGSEFANASLKYCYSCPSGFHHNPALPVDTRGVCFRTGREKLAPAAFVRKQGLCPEGQFFDPRQGGECWSCPSDYARSITPVTDIAACVAPGKLRCAGVTAPPGTDKSLPGFPVSPDLYGALTAVHLADNNTVILPPALGASMAQFKALHKGEGVSLARSVAATPGAPVCRGVIHNAVSGLGGLDDSARESARFVTAIWQRRNDEVSVIRSSNMEYLLVDTKGRILARTRQADCQSNSDKACWGSDVCARAPGMGSGSKRTCVGIMDYDARNDISCNGAAAANGGSARTLADGGVEIKLKDARPIRFVKVYKPDDLQPDPPKVPAFPYSAPVELRNVPCDQSGGQVIATGKAETLAGTDQYALYQPSDFAFTGATEAPIKAQYVCVGQAKFPAPIPVFDPAKFNPKDPRTLPRLVLPAVTLDAGLVLVY